MGMNDGAGGTNDEFGFTSFTATSNGSKKSEVNCSDESLGATKPAICLILAGVGECRRYTQPNIHTADHVAFHSPGRTGTSEPLPNGSR